MKLELMQNRDYPYKILKSKRNIIEDRFENEKYYIVSEKHEIVGICRVLNENYYETWFHNTEVSRFFFENFNFESVA